MQQQKILYSLTITFIFFFTPNPSSSSIIQCSYSRMPVFVAFPLSLFPLYTLYDSVYLQILVSFTCYVRRGSLTQVPTIVLVILSCCVT